MSTVYASIDLGGTNIKCTFARADGEAIISRSIPTQSYLEPEGVLRRMADLIRALQEEAGVRPEAIGMGVPGLADLENGVTKFLPNLPTQWRDVPVRKILGKELGCQVYLLNDVRMATLGELVYGHGQNASTMVFFALGTGIGGGVVVEGKLRLGPVGAAGELGHLCVLPDGPLCGCGARGCVETVASGPAITAAGVRLMLAGLASNLHEITGGDVSRVDPRTMTEAANAGEETVREALRNAAYYLGIAAANMVTSLHPDLIVLGGGVAQIGDLLFDTVRETIRERVRMLDTDTVDIKPSLLGNNAGTLGGIALARKQGRLAE